MNFDDKNCVQVTTDKNIVVKEQKSMFRLLNPERVEVRQVEVDDCLIQDQERKKCDWLFEVDDQNCAIYVELKGEDLEAGFAQLMATMGYLKARHRGKMKEGHIVASKARLPRFKKTSAKLKRRMRGEHEAELIIHSGRNGEGLRLDKRPYKR